MAVPIRSNNATPKVTAMSPKSLGFWNLFSALVLLPEEQALFMAKRVLQGFGIKVHAAATLAEAEQVLRSTRLDLAICDLDVPRAQEFALLQPATHWRGVSVGLMSSARFDQPGNRRVQLRLPKPVTVDMLVRSLKASYSSMAQQRIVTYRHTVPARLVSGTLNHRGWQRTLHQVSVLNVSQTGLCLSAAEPLPHGASLTMSLVLPECSFSVHTSGNIVWSHSSGRTGVAFDRLPCPELKKLHERLNTWLPRELGMVARLA